MKNATLVIMAAGLGSRFRGGKKQLEPIGLHGETLMEYSICDAAEAGFNKVVFVIRDDFEEEFKEKVGNKVKNFISCEYVYQNLEDVPVKVNTINRKKPWGTGQAVLAVKNVVHEPFCVINADDYYGKDSFKKMYNFLTTQAGDDVYGMVGYQLKNTLSANGGVSRGICMVNPNQELIEIKESYNIAKVGDIILSTSGELDPNFIVSTNMWGFYPSVFSKLEEQFKRFLNNMDIDDTRSEFLLPDFVDELIKNKQVRVKVLSTTDKWLGITYRDDTEDIQREFRKMYMNGIYKDNLFEEKTLN